MRHWLPIFALSSGCGYLGDEPSWLDQLVADSPCFRVDLLDGLDESSSNEVMDLFACVNKFGHIDPLTGTAQTLQTSNSRANASPAVEVARAVNAMLEVEVDPFVVAGVLVEALRSPDVSFDGWLDLALEWLVGEAAADARNHPDTLNLDHSVLVPLLEALEPAIGVLLDEDLRAAVWAGEVLGADETKRWVRTAGSMLESDDPAVREPLETALPNVGHAIEACQDGTNDRWSDASGNSLLDFTQVYIVQEDPVLAQIAPDLAPLVSDPLFANRLELELVNLHEAGALQAMPDQLAWMANVDLNGDPLGPGSEPSALFRFLRLLSETNQPMECTVGIWPLQIDFSFGNLAVTTLEIIADMDPQTAAATASFISLLTDNAVSEILLDLAVGTSACPTLTQDVVDDLVAVDVLTQPESQELLVVVVGLLDAAKNSGINHIPDVANALDLLHEGGGTQPLEELVRDLGPEPLVADLVQAIPVLANPESYGIQAGEEPAVDLSDAVWLLEWAFVPHPKTGLAGLEELRPLLRPILSQPETWTAVDRAGSLMRDESTQTSSMLELIPPLLALDPELVLLDQIGPLLAETAISEPMLRALEAPGVLDSLTLEVAQAPAEEPPMIFLGRLIADGTLDDLLALVDRLVGALMVDSNDESNAGPSSGQ